MTRETVVLKIGGSVGAEGAALSAAVSAYERSRPLIVVHGGGPFVSEWSKRLGLETRFARGLRVTDAATRDVALAVLAGLANKTLVAELIARGVPAVGLSGVDGATLRAEREDAELGLVGRVSAVESSLLEDLLSAGRVPVVAPAALDPRGEILNVNADSAAGAIAAAISARLLVLLTDVPGVRGADGRVLALLDRERARSLVESGAVEGGMLPKVEACLVAAAAGCDAAIRAADDATAVERILSGERAGTMFPAEAA